MSTVSNRKVQTKYRLLKMAGLHNTGIKCLQINLKHSRVATNNLMQIIKEYSLDVIFVQEPYTINDKMAGISSNYRIFSYGQPNIRAAIIITNKSVDAIMINQISDSDMVVIELIQDKFSTYAVSMYMDITTDINIDFRKIDNILSFTKGKCLLICMDSNARSKTWYDVITNNRGKLVEEYLTSSNLYIMNEESEHTTFDNGRGKSNVDLTVSNGQLLSRISDWECRGEESCSDHRYLTFNMKHHAVHNGTLDFHGIKYIINDEKLGEFNKELASEFSKKIYQSSMVG